jgi:hypothetical protein
VPGLPGLWLEGTLDKVSSVVWAADEFCGMTKYRRRSLELFLEAVVRSTTLCLSPLLRIFMECSEEELSHFQKDWATRTVPSAPLLPPAWSSWSSFVVNLKSSFICGVPRSIDSTIESTKSYLEQMILELDPLKAQLENYWDRCALSKTVTSHVPVGESLSSPDSIIQALLNIGAAVNNANQLFSPLNEEHFLSATADVTFAHGLCDAAMEVVEYIETLAKAEYLMADQGLCEHQAFVDIVERMQDATTAFKEEMKLYDAMRITVLRRLLTSFTKLCANVDPINYGWSEQCNLFIKMIPS